jgi:DNA-binding NtrC family response regulator
MFKHRPLVPSRATSILVADDQPLLIWALERTLDASGIQIVKAGSRDEVSGRLATGRFDVVVMASQMNESDMSDVIVEIDRQEPDVRLIVLCRGDSAKLRARLWRGIVYETPFSIDRLARAIVEPSSDTPVMNA